MSEQPNGPAAKHRGDRLYGPVLLPLACLIVLAGIFLCLERNMVVPDSVDFVDDKISGLEKLRIDVFLDITKLLISLAVAIIGGTGVLLIRSMDQKQHVHNIILVVGAGALLSAIMSIFFGHMSFSAVIFMLSNSAFPSQMGVYGQLQYIFFLLALIFFGAYVSGLIFDRRLSDE